MVELVAERGYEAVKVSDLAGRARVSTRTFYERCHGKQACLLDTYDEIMRRAGQRIGAIEGREGNLRGRSRLALTALAAALVERPDAARLVCLDASAAGLGALERMQGAEKDLAALVVSHFASDPGGSPLGPTLSKGIVAGISQVIRARLIARRPEELPTLVEDLLEWMLSLSAPEVRDLDALDDAAGDASSAAAALTLTSPPDAAIDPIVRERELILAATIQLAVRDGYWQLTLPRIRAATGLSRRRLEAHFQDVEDCFVEALELVSSHLMVFVREESQARGPDWPAGFHHAVASLCANAASDPGPARLAFIEVFASGPLGLRHLSRFIATTAERLRSAAPAGRRPSAAVAEAAMGAVWGIVRDCVASQRSDRLPELAPLLSYLALSPMIGTPAAIEAIRAEERRSRTSRPISRRPRGH